MQAAEISSVARRLQEYVLARTGASVDVAELEDGSKEAAPPRAAVVSR